VSASRTTTLQDWVEESIPATKAMTGSFPVRRLKLSRGED
jgi:hypothetical protein